MIKIIYEEVGDEELPWLKMNELREHCMEALYRDDIELKANLTVSAEIALLKTAEEASITITTNYKLLRLETRAHEIEGKPTARPLKYRALHIYDPEIAFSFKMLEETEALSEEEKKEALKRKRKGEMTEKKELKEELRKIKEEEDF